MNFNQENFEDNSKYKIIKSRTIKIEINRFESVHPCIYEIYDLLDQISELKISNQIREFVHCIEDSFINSQEWTLPHGIQEIKLGVLGASCSGKSSLIHRYLTGTYIQNEYDEGGRFKKEVILDGDDSHLMMIRDDGSEPPDTQFSNWVDGVIFVFSLENEESLNLLYKLHDKLFKLRSSNHTMELPCILVGTQDYISESNPRVIDDSRARKLAADLKMCAYYETCATYGLNVEKVFQETAMTLEQVRLSRLQREMSICLQNRSSSLGSAYTNQFNQQTIMSKPMVNSNMGTLSKFKPNTQINMLNKLISTQNLYNPQLCSPPVPPTRDSSQTLMLNQNFGTMKTSAKPQIKPKPTTSNNSSPIPMSLSGNPFIPSSNSSCLNDGMINNIKLTESNISNIPFHQHSSSSPPMTQFNRSSTTSASLREKAAQIGINAVNSNQKIEKKVSTNGIGVGRAIPLKQGILYKRRGDKTLAKERTKKYVTLTSDARLTYHPNLNDYMENVHAKEIDLSRVTVKIPGIVYRHGAGGIPTMGAGLTISAMKLSRNRVSDPTGNLKGFRDMGKKSRRKIATNDGDSFEFQIVSLDGKQWSFDAGNEEERDEWVNLVEQAILECLQNMDIRRSPIVNSDSQGYRAEPENYDKDGHNKLLSPTNEGNDATSDAESRKKMIQDITTISGNIYCADCGQQKPEWASLNLGALVCIECSGVHRKLGTHISRVRSLQLDQWAPEWQAVMKAIGNTVANTVWEAAVNVNPRNLRKPEPVSSSKEKEEWIRSKYERREFLPPLPCPGWPIQQQLIDAISRRDIRQVILCLAIASETEVNANDPRAPIHIAAAIGDIVCLQLLIWYKGQVELKDVNGRNGYFYAKMHGQDVAAEFLLKNGCSKQVITATNQIPFVNSNIISITSIAGSVPSKPANDNIQYNTMSKKNMFSSPKQPTSTTNSR